MFTAKGKLIYDPTVQRANFKARKDVSWACKLSAPESIIRYYQFWVRNELGVNLNTPAWDSHITVCKYERPPNESVWRKYHNETISFSYDGELRGNDTYFWLVVQCPRLEEIRTELGLTPQPRHPFHWTVGNLKNVSPMKEKQAPYLLFPWEK